MNIFQSVFWTLCTFWALATPSALANFIPIPAGVFTMGSPESENGRDDGSENQVPVELSKSFEIMSTEVTQSFYVSLMNTNPSHFKSKKYCRKQYQKFDGIELCPNHPVENVSWQEIQDFIAKLNQQTGGYTYRLPTEAEWEYAARAGTTTAWSFGDDPVGLGDYAWYGGNSEGQTHPVAQKKANPWGLYDMHGNVWEWVQDNYADILLGGRDPLQITPWPNHVVRGGGWDYAADGLRSAFRGDGYRGNQYWYFGFRLVRTLNQ